MEYLVIVAIACGLGLATRGALLRYSGVERAKSQAKSAKFDGSAIVAQIQGVMPISRESEREALASLARSGVRMTPSDLWASRFICGGIGLALGIFGSTQTSGAQGLIWIPLGVVVGLLLPQLYLLSERAKWREDIERSLPNALDLLCISVSAGTTFEAGVRAVSEKTTGPLADSLKDVVQAAQYMRMTEALKRLADAAGVQPLTIFVASLIQAEDSGIPLADILKTQAEAVRTYRRQKLEEKINKLPTKMVLPCLMILSTLLIWILTPTLMQLVSALGSMAG